MSSSYSVEAILKATGAADFSKAFKGAADQVDNMAESTRKSSKGLGSMLDGVGKIAVGIGLTKALAVGFGLVRNSIGDAVSRVDTLNQFPKMMEAVGFSADDSEASINRLSEGIQGLPTTLDGVAATAQQLAVLTGDIEGATETTLALNNAFLASGADSGAAERGLQQYTQMLSRGEVDMQSWRTLQETMGVALNDTAEAFGFAGASAQNDLYAALQDGSITFDEFNDKIIGLSNETGGFADRALVASKGIKTSMQNVKTAITTGLANAIQTVNDEMEARGFGSISDNLDKVKEKVQEAFSNIVNAIGPTIDTFQALYDTIVESTAFQTLTDLLGVALEKFNEMKTSFEESGVIEVVVDLFEQFAQAILDIDFVQLLTDVTDFLERMAPVIGMIGGAIVAFKLITAVLAIKAAVMGTAAAAAGLLSGAILFLTSPIGIAIAIIAALIAIGIALYQNWDVIKEKAAMVHNALQDFFQAIWAAGVKYFGMMIDWIVGAFWAFDTKVRSIAQAFKNGVINVFTSLWKGAVNIFKSFDAGVRAIVLAMKNAVINFFTALWTGAVRIFQSLVTGVVAKVNALRTSVTNIITNIKNTFSRIFNSLAGVVTGAFSKVVTNVRNGITRAYNVITGFFSKFKSAGSNIVGSIADGITGAISKATDAIGGVVSKVRDFLPFSPAKEGPLRDLNKLNFGGTIADSIYGGQREISNAMSKTLDMKPLNVASPQMNASVTHTMDNSISRTDMLLEKLASRNQDIYLDGDTLVGSTYSRYDRAGGNRTQITERWGR